MIKTNTPLQKVQVKNIPSEMVLATHRETNVRSKLRADN